MDTDSLYAAAIAGDDDAIAQLAMKVDEVNKYGETILHIESENGNADRVRFILREFANKNLLTKISRSKCTALHLALYEGHTEVAEILIDAARHLPVTSFQAFLSQGDKDMDTALHAAVMYGNVAIVKLLVEADPNDSHIQNDEGKTPMYIAVEKGLNDIAEIISKTCTAPSLDGPDGRAAVRIQNLDQGKSPGGTQYKIMDRYAFYAAAITGDVNAIARLEKEADQLNQHKETILHTECKNGNTEHVRFILREFASKNLLVKLTKNKCTALHLALYNGHTEVAEILIDAARHLPATSFQTFLRQGDKDMDTALHAAVMERYVAIVKLLVEADPTDTHIQNYRGVTPMYMAVERGYNDIAEIIFKTCAAPSLDAPDGSGVVCIQNLDQGKSPGGKLYKIMDKYAFYAAAIAGDVNAIARLEMKADQLNKREETILHTECENGNTEHVRFILREFASKNLLVKLTINRCTALHLALDGGHTELAEILIDAARHLPVTSFQAFLRQGDNYMETALHTAVRERYVAIVKLLVEADPTDTHIQNNLGVTPMYMAVERGYNDIAEIIFKTCAAPSLDGPGGSAAVRIQNLDQGKSPGGTLYKIMDRYDIYVAATAGDADAIATLEMMILNGGEGTILDVETQNRNAERVRFIMRELAKKNRFAAVNSKKQTALHLAVVNGHTEVAEMLIDAAKHLPPDDDNTHNNSVTSFQAFLRQADRYDGNTALHKAVMEGHAFIVKLLVEADPSDTHTQNSQGKTPMYIAVEEGYKEIVKLLCTTCTAPSLKGPGVETALHAAIKYPDHDNEVVKVLIGAARFLSSSSDDDDSQSPVSSFQDFIRQGDKAMNAALHIAVMQGNLTTAKLLVEADPSYPHIQNQIGETPIYIAAERGYYHILKMICTTSTAPLNLDGPGGTTGGTTTALHVAIKNLNKAGKEDRDVIKLMIEAVKLANNQRDVDQDQRDRWLIEFFDRRDEKRCMILELAVEGNYLDVVELILSHHPVYHLTRYPDFIGLMPLIYKAMDKENNDMINLLTQTYQRGVQNVQQDIWQTDYHSLTQLLSAIGSRKEEYVLITLGKDYFVEHHVTFADNLGWTVLHHAAYHEFDSIIHAIVEAQKKFGHSFVYKDMVSTPFHVAAAKGYTSTVIRLMQSWPSSSPAYTAVDKNGQNILHLAALQSNKEMIQGILTYCSQEYKKEFVNKQDNNGDTPLHILIRRGCFVPELLRYEGLDLRVENEEKWTAPDLLYFEDQIIDDQVQIKIALDAIQIDPSKDIFSTSVLPSKRMRKDKILNEQSKLKMHEKYARMKEDTDAIANCFAEAIAGDAISIAALKMKADKLNEEGETILHVESKKGQMENVRFILSEFANKSLLCKLDTSKQTALHLAAHHGHTQVVETLIDAARHLPSSTNPVSSIQDFIRQTNGQLGNTALHLAVLNDNVAIVKLLVEAQPNVSHVRNNEGKTPIYIAAENGYRDIIKEICTICKALSLDGPDGRTTALHALIQNISQEGASEFIGMMVEAAKGWSSAQNASVVDFEALFSRTDESGRTVLQLAVERNDVNAVRLILKEDPAYQPGREIKRNGLMRLICKEYSNDIIELLSNAYKAGIDPEHEEVLALILAIQKLDEGAVLDFLKDAKYLVKFKEDNGWTPLHYAVYHEFDSILEAIIKAQKDVGHSFVYGNMESTPFYVAIKHGHTSTLLRLMELWPASSPTSIAANFPYTVVNDDRQNILHLAAASASRKEMVQGILKYCPENYKDEILNQQDINANTPLHLLISHGCFIPELIKRKGLDTMARNKRELTPRDMLYVLDDIVADQVNIKFAIDDIQTNQSVSKLWGKRTEKKMDIWKFNKTPPSIRKEKDEKFEEEKRKMMDKEHERKKKDLETYKTRTNTQILVTALITTVTFTVGFTMPGGLGQSGDVDEGLVVLSRKRAFNVFMVSDALALLMSTSSLFFYFLESMSEDPHEVSLLNASSTVLNILSIMAMMLTFIAGTYVVLSSSPALAIAVCIISSLFFLLIILWIIKIVYYHRVKKNVD